VQVLVLFILVAFFLPEIPLSKPSEALKVSSTIKLFDLLLLFVEPLTRRF
jgi:hypothetical protein